MSTNCTVFAFWTWELQPLFRWHERRLVNEFAHAIPDALKWDVGMVITHYNKTMSPNKRLKVWPVLSTNIYQQSSKEEYKPWKWGVYGKIRHISLKDYVTNEEVRAKIQQAIGPHEDLLIIVKRRKLQWYGHVSRSSGLAKTILQSTVKGGRRQGRQKKKWEDIIREWTGLEFTKSQRAVEKRKNGGNWLLNHLWYPNDPRG